MPKAEVKDGAKKHYYQKGFYENGINKKTGTLYNQKGFDIDGFDKDGYDKYGFDKYGIHRETGTEYDKNGLNKDRLDKNGFNFQGYYQGTTSKYDDEGFDRKGFDSDGYGRDGYNKSGFNRKGIHRETGTVFRPSGLTEAGKIYDSEGYNAEGYDMAGFGRDGYNKKGFNIEGFDKDGYDIRGFDKEGIHKETGTKFGLDGFDKDGYDIEGFNSSGYDKDRYDREGFNKKGLDREGFNREGINQRGFNKQKIHIETNTQYDNDGFDINGYNEKGYNKNGYNILGITPASRKVGYAFDEEYYSRIIAPRSVVTSIEQLQQALEPVRKRTIKTGRDRYGENLDITKRIQTLSASGPIVNYVQAGPFSGYLKLLYPKKNICIYEKIIDILNGEYVVESYGDATYVLDFETLRLLGSKNFKSEIVEFMKTNKSVQRINHDENWHKKIQEILDRGKVISEDESDRQARIQHFLINSKKLAEIDEQLKIALKNRDEIEKQIQRLQEKREKTIKELDGTAK